MIHNTAATVADKALAERLARHSDGATKGRWCQFNPCFSPEAEGTKCTEWDTSHEISAFANGHRVRLAEWRHANDAAYAEVLVNAHRSGQLITLAEAQAMVAASLRIHAGRCEDGESITEKYLRRYPHSKKTRSWIGAMVHLRTMNGIWKPDGHGYTINFADAWVLPLEQARKTVSGIYQDHGGTYYRASTAAIRAAATGTKDGE